MASNARTQWPTDPEWRRFAARIADGVTLHINRHGKITVMSDATGPCCRCPLGCVSPHAPFFPSSLDWRELELDQEWMSRFIAGFESKHLADSLLNDPSALLGRAYRDRFVTGGFPAATKSKRRGK